ncbi:ABC transporter B family member 9-like [Olea europaea subsp. europaea]|uniref:ABC transporter B family member 9-like n=1 Tax=Olea europaea subsp. europaea TaxID=158383 RepID=A0A8S0T7L1_OLEEU|nr:ABC transporter B family member 9-like [Olea europaea subsp. europaea]
MKMWIRGQVAYAEAGYVAEQIVGAIRMVAYFIRENKATRKYDSKLQIAYASTVQQWLASCIVMDI